SLDVGDAFGVRLLGHAHSLRCAPTAPRRRRKRTNASAVPTKIAGDMLFIMVAWDGRRERRSRLRSIVARRTQTSTLQARGAREPAGRAGEGFSNPCRSVRYGRPGRVPILNLPAKTRMFYLNLPVWSVLCAPCSVGRKGGVKQYAIPLQSNLNGPNAQLNYQPI